MFISTVAHNIVRTLTLDIAGVNNSYNRDSKRGVNMSPQVWSRSNSL